MIKFHKLKDKRNWLIEFSEAEECFELEFFQSSIVNSFDIVKDFMGDICETLPDFEYWYLDLLKEYMEEYNSEIVLFKAHEIKNMATQYVEEKNIDYDSFLNKKKISKSSIIFYGDDIKTLIIASTCLKIYSIFQYEKTLKIPENIHKQIFNIFMKDSRDKEIPDKIFEIVKARTYRSSFTDKHIWDLIKMSILETPESYSISVFNSIMNNLIVMLSVGANPINYIVSIVNDALRWMMCNVYREHVVYDEVFGETNDIYGGSQSKETFYLHCCKDLIFRISNIGMDIIEKDLNMETLLKEKHDLEEKGEEFTERYVQLKNEIGEKNDTVYNIRDRLDSLSVLEPNMKFLTLPIASEVLEIPYKYLLTTSPKNIMLIGIFLRHISEEILAEDYPNLIDFLIAYSKDKGSFTTKSTYQIRNIHDIINSDESMFGLGSISLKYETISPICGLLCANKRNLVSIYTGEKLSSLTYNDIEKDSINFYMKLYSNSLKPKFDKMREIMNGYF